MSLTPIFSSENKWDIGRHGNHGQTIIDQIKGHLNKKSYANILDPTKLVQNKAMYANARFRATVCRVNGTPYGPAMAAAQGLVAGAHNPPAAKSHDRREVAAYDTLLETQIEKQVACMEEFWSFFSEHTLIEMKDIKNDDLLTFHQKIADIYTLILANQIPHRRNDKKNWRAKINALPPTTEIFDLNFNHRKLLLCNSNLQNLGAGNAFSEEELCGLMNNMLEGDKFIFAQRWFDDNHHDPAVMTIANFILEIRKCFPGDDSYKRITDDMIIADLTKPLGLVLTRNINMAVNEAPRSLSPGKMEISLQSDLPQSIVDRISADVFQQMRNSGISGGGSYFQNQNRSGFTRYRSREASPARQQQYQDNGGGFNRNRSREASPARGDNRRSASPYVDRERNSGDDYYKTDNQGRRFRDQRVYLDEYPTDNSRAPSPKSNVRPPPPHGMPPSSIKTGAAAYYNANNPPNK